MNLFTPAEFTENYAQAGVKKASLPVGKMLLLGILAGFLIAMGGATASTASHAIPNAGLAKMVSGLLFPFGLAMVILTGAELFTGNVLINISVFEGKTGFASMLRNWFWVYIGNFCGALLVAAGMAFLGCLNLSGGGFAVSTMKVAAAGVGDHGEIARGERAESVGVDMEGNGPRIRDAPETRDRARHLQAAEIQERVEGRGNAAAAAAQHGAVRKLLRAAVAEAGGRLNFDIGMPESEHFHHRIVLYPENREAASGKQVTGARRRRIMEQGIGRHIMPVFVWAGPERAGRSCSPAKRNALSFRLGGIFRDAGAGI